MSYRGCKVLALVPARGGSKGVVRKNLRMLRNRPLVAYTIDAARSAAVVDEVFVSSDDEEVLDLARSMEVTPVLRPPEAATDEATASAVVASFVDFLDPSVVAANPYVAYLQPTSPLRTASHIDAAFRCLDSGVSSSVMSVVPMKRTPFKSFKLDPAGTLEPLFDERTTTMNRQQLPAVYYPNGAIYIFSMSDFLRRGHFPTSGSAPFVMSERDSLDIDSEDDLLAAERSDA